MFASGEADIFAVILLNTQPAGSNHLNVVDLGQRHISEDLGFKEQGKFSSYVKPLMRLVTINGIVHLSEAFFLFSGGQDQI